MTRERESLLGRTIGHYAITAVLGSGGMGTVYRARDTKLGREVAIKILPDVWLVDPDRRARFEREGRVLAALNHPNIATIYGLEDAAGTPAIVMELVAGETLADRIARAPRGLPVAEALAIARQIVDALDAAHEKGIVHRDLKPSNIAITPDGRVKVLDFGLAKLAAGDGATQDVTHSPTMTVSGTRDGVLLGTAAYMSPEQARGQVVDKRTDIWAFGCLLYELLTGRPAFRGETISDTLVNILEREPDWSALPNTTPPSVDRLLKRCFERNPRRRLRDIGDAAFDLDDTPVTAAAQTPAARQWSLWAAWMVAAATSASLLMVFASRPTAPSAAGAGDSVVRFQVATPSTGDTTSFALSPDARQLAFVAADHDVPKLWIRRFDRLEPQPLAGTDQASYPFWAPDAAALGFFAEGKLKRVDLADGRIRVLADARNARGGAWSPAGAIVFAPSGASGLFSVPATGGAPRPVTELRGGQGSHRWPQFLPGGQRLLFLSALGDSQSRGVYVASLSGGTPTRVLDADSAAEFVAPDGLFVVRQGVLVRYRFDIMRAEVSDDPRPIAQPVGSDTGVFHGLFSTSASGAIAFRTGGIERRQLQWVDRSGRVERTVYANDENGLADLDLSPDGRHVAVTRTIEGNDDVWLIDTERGVASRFTVDAASESFPVWSPDGRRVVYVASSTGLDRLMQRSAFGSDPPSTLLTTAATKTPLSWSRDGRFVLYAVASPATGADVWALPTAGDRKPFKVVETAFDEGCAQIAPDGRWMAYQSNETGRNEVYVVRFPDGGGRVQISSSGGSQPRWAPNGSELFYVDATGRLVAVPINVRIDAETLVPGTPSPLFQMRMPRGANIFGGVGARAQYAVVAENRFLVNTSVAQEGAPITVVLPR